MESYGRRGSEAVSQIVSWQAITDIWQKGVLLMGFQGDTFLSDQQPWPAEPPWEGAGGQSAKALAKGAGVGMVQK